MPSASTSGRLSPSPASLNGAGGSRISPRERKQGNPISQFRSTNSLRSSSSSGTLKGSASNAGEGLLGGRGKRGGNFKGKDRYSDTPEDDEVDLLGATPGLRGRGEADGEFDEGWTGADDEREGLLGVSPLVRRNPVAETDSPSQTSAPTPTIHAPTTPKVSHGNSRTIQFNSLDKKSKFPANLVRNQKYNIVTFLPIVLYEQFKFFFNLYFLLVALSQFVPALRIGESSFCLVR